MLLNAALCSPINLDYSQTSLQEQQQQQQQQVGLSLNTE
jgi:hypothetical protein